ncbi:MAG: hypothetical protein L0241_10745 [Planctomycetia bacterium]|nr:hypothetical protein [Planctomycetia bacterium]
MRPLALPALVLLTGLLACGCALTAKKVPTPAAQITSEDLAQLPKPPDERYFLILFGSHDLLRRPQYTHTWATLVRMRASDAGPCGTVTPGCIDPALDVHTISWLPTKGTIDPRNYTVEPGRNYELHETLRLVYDTKQSVAVWGPYEVWHGFAHRFLVQKQFLDTGSVGYQCVDTRGEAARLGNGCDCIHAVTDMDPIYPRWRYPLAVYGKPATANLTRRFMHSPIWIDPKTTHDWLLSRLGLGAYPLQKRKYIGKSEEHTDGAPADLDSRSLPVPVVPPKQKEPTPKTAPGIENKKPIDPVKKP